MKVFLTGGTGFLGGALARSLRRRGDEVLALARDWDKSKALAREGCQIVNGDLSASRCCACATACAAVYDQQPLPCSLPLRDTRDVWQRGTWSW